MTLEPGNEVRLVTGEGTNTADTVYWGIGNPVWNKDGDTVTVRDATGEIVLSEDIAAPKNGDGPPVEDPPVEDPPENSGADDEDRNGNSDESNTGDEDEDVLAILVR